MLDRDTPIVRIVSYTAEAVEVRRAIRRPCELELPPPASPTDSLAVLLEDRRRR